MNNVPILTVVGNRPGVPSPQVIGTRRRGNFYLTFGQGLSDRNWRTTPIRPKQKAPSSSGWQNAGVASADEIERHSLKVGTGIGIVLGEQEDASRTFVVGLDLDIMDRTLAGRIESLATSILGFSPVRSGAPPKTMMLFRCDAPTGKLKTADFVLPRDPTGAKHHVEILAAGQQFVAYGHHPRGTDYKWRGGHPAEIEPADLTPVSTTKLQQFLLACETEFTDAGGIAKGRGVHAAVPGSGKDDLFKGNLGLHAGLKALIKELGRDINQRDGKLRFRCGFAHPDRPDSGTVLMPGGGVVCHHSGCLDHTTKDHIDKLKELVADDGGDPDEIFNTASAKASFDRVSGLADPTPVVRLDGTIDFGTVSCEPSEDGLSAAFVALTGNLLRFDHNTGKWFVWVEDHWAENETGLAAHWAQIAIRQFRKGSLDGPMKALSKISVANSVERAARAYPAIAVTRDAWDRDPYLLGVPGGEVDLRTGGLSPPDPAHMISRQTTVAPARPGTPHPIWSSFLWDATGGDPAFIEFLRMWAGYTLTGDTSEEAFAFVHGPGKAGKTTFMSAITHLMGSYAVMSPMEVFMTSKHDRHPTEIARMAGARLVTASETEHGRTWAMSRIKEMTGREARLAGRFMHRDFFEFTPTFKLFLVGNHKPRMPEADSGMARRLNLLPFTHPAPKADVTLKDRLVPEYPAILRWMIDGALDWRRVGGLAAVRPTIVTDATKEYIEDENPLRQWADERLEFDPKERVPTGTLFQDWSQWCGSRRVSPGSDRSFGSRLATEYPAVSSVKGTAGVRSIQGAKLKPEFDCVSTP